MTYLLTFTLVFFAFFALLFWGVPALWRAAKRLRERRRQRAALLRGLKLLGRMHQNFDAWVTAQAKRKDGTL